MPKPAGIWERKEGKRKEGKTRRCVIWERKEGRQNQALRDLGEKGRKARPGVALIWERKEGTTGVALRGREK